MNTLLWLFKNVHKYASLWFQASIAFCHLVLRSHKLVRNITVDTDGFCFHFQAFADTVVERPAQPSFTFHPQSSAPSISAPSVSAAAAAEHEAGASSRPISKFRASRQKSNSATSTLSPSGAALQGQDGGSATSTRPVSKFRASRQKQDDVRWSLEGLKTILWRIYSVMPSSGFSLQPKTANQAFKGMSSQYTPM